MSLGFPPGEPVAGLASLQLGCAGVLPLPFPGQKTCAPTVGCGSVGTISPLQSCVSSFAELWGWSGHPGQGPPYAVGLEWVRGCRWELHSLEPSEHQGHGSTGALLPRLSYIVLAPVENSVFLGYGEAWSGVGGGLGRRLLSLQQQGQNSRKEEGPDEPLSWPLLDCRAWSLWALLCCHGHGPTARALGWQLHLCSSLPQEVPLVIGVHVRSQGCACQHSSQPSRAALCSVLGVVAFFNISSLQSPNI